MRKALTVMVLLSAMILFSCGTTGPRSTGYITPQKPVVTLGCERLLTEHFDLVKGMRVGLITNATGVDSSLRSTIDLIHECRDVEITALFGPEHGIRGSETGAVENSMDKKTGVPVYSLHGKHHRPTKEMLENVDVLVFDIQDNGSRSYTFITTMARCMQSAAEFNKPFIVLDRPNPINGLVVDGPILEKGFESGIGIGPIAYVHGMTVGELAGYFNNEEDFNYGCDLEVVKMKGWKREMSWPDTGLIWVQTSPHIPEPDSSLYYPITGIYGETPLVNIGVGYTLPFKMTGAPWINGVDFCDALNAKKIPGVYFRSQYYRPYYYHFEKEMCEGCQIYVTDHRIFRPVETSYHIMAVLRKLYPDEFNFELEKTKHRLRMFDLANGTDKVRKWLMQGKSAEEIIKWYQPGLDDFRKKREKYLLY